MSVDRSSPLLIQSIERAAAVMRSFTEAQPELGVTELSHHVGLHKSTVSRILTTLQKEGFVSQNPATGKYRLGVGLISLAGVALRPAAVCSQCMELHGRKVRFFSTIELVNALEQAQHDRGGDPRPPRDRAAIVGRAFLGRCSPRSRVSHGAPMVKALW